MLAFWTPQPGGGFAGSSHGAGMLLPHQEPAKGEMSCLIPLSETHSLYNESKAFVRGPTLP